MMPFQYPSADAIESDPAKEDMAVKTAMSALMSAMHGAVAGAPLDNALMVYAALELAFHYGDDAYVEEVFNEILVRRTMVPQ